MRSGSGGYVNFLVEADEDRVRATYGGRSTGASPGSRPQFDPDNVFHLNANIKPAKP